MFDKDAVFSSKCVAISTLLSIITAPAVISIMVKGLL
jgi:predicted permease